MDILFKFIGFFIVGPSIFIAFEIPGTNKDYQTYGILGCVLLAISGFAVATITEESIGSEGFGFSVCFTLIMLALGISSLLYWNKRKHL